MAERRFQQQLQLQMNFLSGREKVRSLINRPEADLDFVGCDGKHLEIIERSVFLIVWNNQTIFFLSGRRARWIL